MAQEKKKITAQELRRQAEAMDELKKMGDEQMFGKLEEVMAKASEIDIPELMSGLQKIVEGDETNA